ncbi:LacI family DNA-binding transcriptional regulator [Actinotalea solisilvae]|uniref:LacI family DNA-binding transcriptional regulator n=1 Tax=Actinotalea solisilvae TaxID=2072922 RepID=UPI0018F277D0
MSRVGLKDVAEAAGVSITTVSHVLNETPHVRVSPQTRQRVQDVAARLNYRPNRMARGLRTRSSGMIGLLTEEIATTPHAGRIILGAQEAASRHNLTLAIINSALMADADERREDVNALLDRHVDGIIYATVYHDVVSPPAELRSVPAVLIGARDRAGQVPSVVPDEQQGAHDAVLALAAAGHRRIAFAGNSDDVPATRGRRVGYLTGMAAAGLTVDPDLIADAESEPLGGHESASRLLAAAEPPTAIFCYNDRMAMGVYRALNDRGLRIPEDLSVIGFDDQQPIASGLFPGLTTVALPHYEMGAWAVESLAAQLAGTPTDGGSQPLRLPCPLVTRSSVAPVRTGPPSP